MCFVLSFSVLALSVCFADSSPRVGAFGKPGQLCWLLGPDLP